MINMLIASVMIAASPAEAAEMAADLPVKEISEKPSGWFDRLSQRNVMCGKSGERGEKLAELYDAITSSDTGEGAVETARSFLEYRDSSNMAGSCWETLRARAGISRGADKLIEKIADAA